MFKSYTLIKKLIVSLLTGLLVGLVVGIYQFILPYVTKGSEYMFNNHSWWVILLNIVLIIMLSVLNFFIIKKAGSVDSSGIIAINLALRHNEDISFKKEIPLMIINSSISTYAQLPLGSEGPSITLAGKCASLINHLFKVKDDDNIKIAFGAGFGGAFVSPLSGFFYAFEEELHKVNLELILRTLITIIGMGAIIILLNSHHSLSFDFVNYLPITEMYVLFIASLLIVIVAPIFLFTINTFKKFFNKYENNFFVKYRAFIFFILMIIFGYTIIPYLGSGDKIIDDSLMYQSVYLIVLILVFRIILTSIMGNGKVTGGLIVPSLCFGALIGSLSSLVFEKYFSLDSSYRSFIILASMCLFFAFISEAPITAVVLFFSNLVYSNESFNVFNYSTCFVILFIIAIFFVTKIFNVKPLYDMLVDTQDDFNKHKIVNK